MDSDKVEQWMLDAAREIVAQLEVDTPYTDDTRAYERNWITAIIAAHAPTPAPPQPAIPAQPLPQWVMDSPICTICGNHTMDSRFHHAPTEREDQCGFSSSAGSVASSLTSTITNEHGAATDTLPTSANTPAGTVAQSSTSDTAFLTERRDFPTKDDCRYLDAIMAAAKQIHEEFDCLSDHLKTKKKIREQISSIIWKHLDKVRSEMLARESKKPTTWLHPPVEHQGPLPAVEPSTIPGEPPVESPRFPVGKCKKCGKDVGPEADGQTIVFCSDECYCND